MSALLFFSSDYPLEEIENPHYKRFSINEALAFGLELPRLILDSEDIDRDKPNIIVWSDLGMEKEIDPVTRKVVDNGVDDDFSINALEDFPDIYTKKKYQATLDWDVYSEGRAKRVVEYIRKHMEFADELEIWHVWLSSYEMPIFRRFSIALEDVTVETVQMIDASDVATDPLTHYCYTIKKNEKQGDSY